MGQAGSVLHRQDPFSADRVGTIDDERRSREENPGRRGRGRDVRPYGLDVFGSRGGGLVHDHQIRHPQVRLPGMVGQLVPGPVRIGDHDVEIGPEERQIVVPAIPHHDIAGLLGLTEDRLVVDAGEHDVPRRRCGSYSSRSSIVMS